MTERQRRLIRLASLREQEHVRSIGSLRLAKQTLASVENHIEAATKILGDCRTECGAALSKGQHDVWLLARAEGEICQLEVSRALQQRHARETEVANAMLREMEARRAFRQMENLALRVRSEALAAASKKEQQHMDETARLLRKTAKGSELR